MGLKLIAELCQNHNGDENILFQMVDEAIEGGATHIKVQHIYAKNLVFRSEFESGYSDSNNIGTIKRPFQLEYERLKALELNDGSYKEFVSYVYSKGAIPLTTCFARCDVKRIAKHGFKEIKVASYDCSSYQLLRELSSSFECIYISTGATFDDEILYANNILSSMNTKHEFLHCVTKYPTPLHDQNLARIQWLKNIHEYVGFSDHSLVTRDGNLATFIAIFLGANVIERHFTVLESNLTKDGPVSVNKDQLSKISWFSKLSKYDQENYLNANIPNLELVLGEPQRKLSNEELMNRAYYRGRFASPRITGSHQRETMIFNWEETKL